MGLDGPLERHHQDMVLLNTLVAPLPLSLTTETLAPLLPILLLQTRVITTISNRVMVAIKGTLVDNRPVLNYSSQRVPMLEVARMFMARQQVLHRASRRMASFDECCLIALTDGCALRKSEGDGFRAL